MKYINIKRYKFSTIFKNINFKRYGGILANVAEFVIFIIEHVFSRIYKSFNFTRHHFLKTYNNINFKKYNFLKILKLVYIERYVFKKIYKYLDIIRFNFTKITKYIDIRRLNFTKIIKYLNLKTYNINRLKKINFISSKFFILHLPGLGRVPCRHGKTEKTAGINRSRRVHMERI